MGELIESDIELYQADYDDDKKLESLVSAMQGKIHKGPLSSKEEEESKHFEKQLSCLSTDSLQSLLESKEQKVKRKA
jgi:hypothetical protein